MHPRLLFALLLWAISTACTGSAHAFSEGGHKVIAHIAWQLLTPQARQRVVETLAFHPRFGLDFASKMPAPIVNGPPSDRAQWILCQAAVWPDTARDTPFDRPKWHYVNFPVYLSLADQQAMSPRLSVNTSATWQPGMLDSRLNVLQALDRIAKTFPSQTADERAVQLCWVLHLVGDLHQPLHCAALFDRAHFPEGDKGGNSVKVRTHPLQRQPTALHALWDQLLGRSLDLNAVKRRSQELLANPQNVREAQTRVQITTLRDWALEGASYAARYAYPPPIRHAIAYHPPLPLNGDIQDLILPEGYPQTASFLINLRATVAGFRLARYLEWLVR
jgi:hypothetical protein